MNREQRINEFTKRQVWYGSSLAVKLSAVNGKWWYSVFAWIDHGKEDEKILVLFSKYNGEDPKDLEALGLKELGLKKIKLGVPHVQ